MRPRVIAILITGLGQGLHEPTGTELVYDAAEDAWSADPGVVIKSPRQWRIDWRAECAFVQRHMATGRRSDPWRTRIIVWAYSWGAGWAFQRFSRYCLSRGIVIDCAVLVDPVYRSPYLPTWAWWLNWTSLTHHGRLPIAPSVVELYQFRQFQNLPRGRGCEPEDRGRTLVHDAIVLECSHQQADDHPRAHDFFHRELARLAAETNDRKRIRK